MNRGGHSRRQTWFCGRSHKSGLHFSGPDPASSPHPSSWPGPYRTQTAGATSCKQEESKRLKKKYIGVYLYVVCNILCTIKGVWRDNKYNCKMCISTSFLQHLAFECIRSCVFESWFNNTIPVNTIHNPCWPGKSHVSEYFFSRKSLPRGNHIVQVGEVWVTPHRKASHVLGLCCKGRSTNHLHAVCI